MAKTQKGKPVPKGETPFGRFERMAKKVVSAPKNKPVIQGTKKVVS